MDYHSAHLTGPGHEGGSDGVACRVGLAEDGLFALPEGCPEMYLSYSDIDQLVDEGTRLSIKTWDGRGYFLSHMGRQYGPFTYDLRERRQRQLVRNLLMLDVDYQKEFTCAYEFASAAGGVRKDAAAKLVLYRNSMVFFPSLDDPLNVWYCDLETVRFDSGAYALVLEFDLEERLVLTKLGTRFSELELDLRRLVDEMYKRTAELLKRSFPPETPEEVLLLLSRALRQGKATSRARIDAVKPGMWERLQDVVFVDENGEASLLRRKAFAYLAERTTPDLTFLGIRETFTSGAEDPRPIYWFMVALPQANAIASEVTNESGYATYFFRITAGSSPTPTQTLRRVAQLNRALQALNFRREVISAREELLATDRFARYRVALRKLPYLREARQSFLGRAVHASEAAWERRVETILAGAGRGEVVLDDPDDDPGPGAGPQA